jgi:hypothetical protein
LEILVAERLQRINQIDIEQAKLLVDVDSAEFMDAVGDRMLSEMVAATNIRKKTPNHQTQAMASHKQIGREGGR